MVGNPPSEPAATCGRLLAPEFALLAACSRWPLDESADRQISRCTAAPLDWDRFLIAVARHRLTSLVFHALHTRDDCVPSRVLHQLSRAARLETRVTMRQIAETARLIARFARAGIGALVLKGPVLSVIAFGNPFRRGSRDIDLIVDARDLERADTLLRSEGYDRLKPEPGVSLTRYRRWVHEFSYYSTSRKLIVEIKDRLDPMMLVPAADISEHIRRPKMVDVGGQELPSMPEVDHFVYLCTHGTRHSWFRLKWVADIAAILRTKSLDLTAVSTRASDMGLERCLYVGLLLARKLLQAPMSEALSTRALSDAVARRLERAAHESLSKPKLDASVLNSFNFTLHLLLVECNIRSDWHYRRTVLERYALSYAYPQLRAAMRMMQRFRS